MPKLAPGLYDQVVDVRLRDALAELESNASELAPLDPGDSHVAIARALHARVLAALKSVSADNKVDRQLDLANRVLALLANQEDAGTDAGDAIVAPANKLLAVLAPVAPPAVARAPERPRIPLSSSDLLVNARHDLSLGGELVRELASADRVDLLCSFVKWSGLRMVQTPLRALVERHPGKLRVLTTIYTGATEQRALDALAELGATIKVSYDKTRTRLHAKAWLFHRRSGFSTGFIGSSNLSAAAMVDGLEWNVRLSHVDNAAILDKFAVAFDQYWVDPEFRTYDPDEFAQAQTEGLRERTAVFFRFELSAKPHQRRILEELEAERAYGHFRNLVVAATGTGKTVVAALDYARLRQQGHERLLFVAHRREILEQSRATFQAALGDGSFGEMLGGGQRPSVWKHVFANIQSLDAELIASFAKDAFDVVIVDEFHHAAAASYDRLLRHFEPDVLLGLTATPERADGRSILEWFDGRTASEIRLWEALDQGLLCPFHYFGVGGAPDLRGVKWSGGRYERNALSNIYTADHLFALRVLQETRAKVRDLASMRALGFCVDIAHAQFMCARFVEHGIRARVVTGETPDLERDAALRGLAAGEVQILFTVDLLNEGVDLPTVDTLLFLRPTESATVFLQQLGRGLRHAHAQGKECCTVLDFIGEAHRRFRFDARYRAILGGSRREVERNIEQGFPSLPAGCFLHLDAQASAVVLANIRTSLLRNRKDLIESLQEYAREGKPSLRGFLDHVDLDLEELYANEWNWTNLRRRAGLESQPAGEGDAKVERSFSRMLHLDDDRIERFAELLGHPRPPAADPDDPYQRLLFVLCGHMRQPYTEMAAAWRHLWARPWLRDELCQLLRILADRRRHSAGRLDGRLAASPLRLHATYSRDEVFAALDERHSKGGVKRTQGGVYHAKRWHTELLFVELEKSEKDYTPTTLYQDYPITMERFRWESQSSAHDGTPAGRRYLATVRGGEQQVLLFVRQRRKDPRGETMPYLCLGQCEIDGHTGARPMRIDWRLRSPMPAWFFEETKLVGG